MGGSGDAGDDAKCMQETPPYNSSPEWGIESGQSGIQTNGTGSSGTDGSPDEPKTKW